MFLAAHELMTIDGLHKAREVKTLKFKKDMKSFGVMIGIWGDAIVW